MLDIAPDLRIVDVTRDPGFDVRAGALASCGDQSCRGIVLAVVDPGSAPTGAASRSGRERRAGRPGQRAAGPAVAMLGGPLRHESPRPAPAPGARPDVAGSDVMAPPPRTASGVPLAALGPGRPVTLAPRRPCPRRGRRPHHRRSPLGRPLRQLPAQRRARTARRGGEHERPARSHGLDAGGAAARPPGGCARRAKPSSSSCWSTSGMCTIAPTALGGRRARRPRGSTSPSMSRIRREWPKIPVPVGSGAGTQR